MAQAIIRTVYKCSVHNSDGPEVFFEFPTILELKQFLKNYSATSGSWTFLLYKLDYKWDDSAKTVSVTSTDLVAADL